MADREMREWRMEHEQKCARAPRLDGLRHVGWLIENEAEGIRLLWNHQPKAMLDSVRRDGFTTFPVYAGPSHAGVEPAASDGVDLPDGAQR